MDTVGPDPSSAGTKIYLQTQAATVRHLGELYTIVVGLSLSSAIADIFTQDRPTIEGRFGSVALLVGFIATLIPFYHGTLRHLDRYHLDPKPPPAQHGALLADFGFIFVQGCLFFALAKYIPLPLTFGVIFWVLLFSNALWVVLTRLVFFRERASIREEWRYLRAAPAIEERVQFAWLGNNAVFLGLLAAILWGARPGSATTDAVVAGFVALVCLGRTCRDYHTAWAFYFPEQPHDTEPEAEAGDAPLSPAALPV